MDQHSKFLERLDKSRGPVFWVAEYLHKAGFTVTVPATRYAPTAKDHPDYVDNGDIIAVKGNETHKIEVKRIFREFKDLASWPFPVVFISNVATVDRANNSVTAYVVLNGDMTHMAVIWAKKKDNWKKIQRVARNTNNPEWYYCCDPKQVDFREL